MTDQNAQAADSSERFATDLRMLRVAAGSPTLAHLQNVTGLSRTVISDAFAGRSLPSARTVDGLVRACDGDVAQWLERRERLAKPIVDEPDTEESEPAKRAARTVRLAIAIPVLVVACALSAGGAALATGGAEGARVQALEQQLKAAGPVNPHAQIQVRTGVDPAMTPCVNDAKVAASEDRTNNTRIQIVWSNKCYAGWARIARYDDKADGNEVKISIYPETAPHGPDRQDATEPGVQGAYTTLVVRPSPETRLCAVGSITLDGKTISLGKPICA